MSESNETARAREEARAEVGRLRTALVDEAQHRADLEREQVTHIELLDARWEARIEEARAAAFREAAKIARKQDDGDSATGRRTRSIAAAIEAAAASPGMREPAQPVEPHVCKCKNEPCPACGGGPSGEWFEGAEVKCDDCGTALMVAAIEECDGASSFTLADIECEACGGCGVVDGPEGEDAPGVDCPKCGGDGTRTPTVRELRAKHGITALATPSPGTAAPAKEEP